MEDYLRKKPCSHDQRIFINIERRWSPVKRGMDDLNRKCASLNNAGKLQLPGRRPTFSDFLDEYLASPIHAQKKQSTQVSERASLEHWREHLGGIRIDKITEVMVKSYCEKRLAQGVTARTAHKETDAFYQVLRRK